MSPVVLRYLCTTRIMAPIVAARGVLDRSSACSCVSASRCGSTSSDTSSFPSVASFLSVATASPPARPCARGRSSQQARGEWLECGLRLREERLVLHRHAPRGWPAGVDDELRVSREQDALHLVDDGPQQSRGGRRQSLQRARERVERRRRRVER